MISNTSKSNRQLQLIWKTRNWKGPSWTSPASQVSMDLPASPTTAPARLVLHEDHGPGMGTSWYQGQCCLSRCCLHLSVRMMRFHSRYDVILVDIKLLYIWIEIKHRSVYSSDDWLQLRQWRVMVAIYVTKIPKMKTTEFDIDKISI